MKAKTQLLSALVLILAGTIGVDVSAQQTNFLAGQVVDDSGIPVSGASVYFSNTSIGDISTTNGEFVLRNLPAGKYELVVSAIGYATKVILVSSADYANGIKVQLHRQSTVLSAVTVRGKPDANGWKKYGKYFLDNFIGTTNNSHQCRLVNYFDLEFRFSDKNNRLTARSEKPLIIENAALGYVIKFRLEEFNADFTTNMVAFVGYPFFEQMNTSSVKRKRNWIKNRKAAYFGSLIHFLRSVYLNRLADEGFVVLATTLLPNVEKDRIENKMENDSASSNDSAWYYRRILKQPDTLIQETSMTSIEPMLTNNSDESRSLYFENKLNIIFNPESRASQLSQIYLSTPEPIEIQRNGSYFSPKELVMLNHWGEFEKISNMLPFDYIP